MSYESETQITQVDASDQRVIQLVSADRADVDTQVATAKRYPRDITRCVNNAIAMATRSVDTAQMMSYALPRGGKPITGPSVHLAKLIVSCWGNIRAGAKVVDVTDKHVVAMGVCWDMENNVSMQYEVRRNIRTKAGARFSDDMITVAGNAANSIALRNAVFAVVPKAIVDDVYRAAQQTITGDLSDENKLIQRRNNCLVHFHDEYGITEEEVVKLAGKQTVNQIRAEEIALLLGVAGSLRDGDTTVDDLMRPIRGEKHERTESVVNPAKNLFGAPAEAAMNAVATPEPIVKPAKPATKQ